MIITRLKQIIRVWGGVVVVVVVLVVLCGVIGWGVNHIPTPKSAYIPALQKKIWVIESLDGEYTGFYYGYK